MFCEVRSQKWKCVRRLEKESLYMGEVAKCEKMCGENLGEVEKEEVRLRKFAGK